MTLKEFQLMSVEEQADVIYQHGVFIGKRNFLKIVVILYQIDAFYVEIYYTGYRKQISYLTYTLSPDILSYYPLEKEIEEVIKSIALS